MFTRIVSFTGASDIDGGIEYLKETVAPLLRQQKGFRGTTASVDRDGKVFSVLSLWETEADRDASESAVAKVRTEAEGIVGGTMSVEMFEQVLFETAGKPKPGVSLAIRRATTDPSTLDTTLAYFKREVLPQIKSEPGFLAVRQMVNRTTGESMVGTVWADVASMDAALKFAEARREQAKAQGVTLGEPSRREIVFLDMP